MITKKEKFKKPPLAIAIKKNDLEIFRENCSSLIQLLALAGNTLKVSDDQRDQEVSEQLNNSITFLENMRFVFQKMQFSDAVKIEK